MDEAISTAALACGVRPSTVRAALGSGTVRVVADLLGMPATEVERKIAELTTDGVERSRALAVIVLAG